ncbi:hypothetical protein ACI2LC_39115 [Nonomuraea wenchangensis]|uniref:hypothetical protein n=1 Tax=Nonomuraea wenchangensis TaxID=568860 RepID=UPI00332BE70D
MQVVEAAVELLESGGPDTVSTRAVAEHGYAQFLESKRALLDPEPKDAVEDLRRAWDTVVEFGISRPELFAVMNRATRRGADLGAPAGGRGMAAGRRGASAVTS